MISLRKPAVVAVALLVQASAVQALDGRTLALINESANDICGSIDRDGGGSSTAIEGNISAELSGLARRLADAGIDGSARLESDDYSNVVRQELGSELANTRECRLRVFEMLVDRVESSLQPEPDPWGSRGPQPAAGPTELAGMIQWGAYINCQVTNTSPDPVTVATINYSLTSFMGPQAVSIPCTFNCGLLGYQSNSFSGPPNGPGIASGMCSVSVLR